MKHLSIRLLLLFCVFVSPQGCAHQRRHSIVRMWADYNSLGEPALFLEQTDHMPYRAVRVGQLRWKYGMDPGHRLQKPKMWQTLPPGQPQNPSLDLGFEAKQTDAGKSSAGVPMNEEPFGPPLELNETDPGLPFSPMPERIEALPPDRAPVTPPPIPESGLRPIPKRNWPRRRFTQPRQPVARSNHGLSL